MNMQQSGIYELLKLLENVLDKSFPILPNYLVAIKVKEVESLIDRIYASLPSEVQEARSFLRRREELQIEAQQKAEKIIIDAQNESSRLLSESDVLRAVQKEAEKIKEQVIGDCETIKRKAFDDAENVRLQAADEAMRIREGAEVYAEQVLVNLERDLNQLQQVVKNGQVYMEKLRSEVPSGYDPLRSNFPQPAQAGSMAEDFRID
jgi:cell division septum initiation protein DivIVA